MAHQAFMRLGGRGGLGLSGVLQLLKKRRQMQQAQMGAASGRAINTQPQGPATAPATQAAEQTTAGGISKAALNEVDPQNMGTLNNSFQRQQQVQQIQSETGGLSGGAMRERSQADQIGETDRRKDLFGKRKKARANIEGFSSTLGQQAFK